MNRNSIFCMRHVCHVFTKWWICLFEQGCKQTCDEARVERMLIVSLKYFLAFIALWIHRVNGILGPNRPQVATKQQRVDLIVTIMAYERHCGYSMMLYLLLVSFLCKHSEVIYCLVSLVCLTKGVDVCPILCLCISSPIATKRWNIFIR